MHVGRSEIIGRSILNTWGDEILIEWKIDDAICPRKSIMVYICIQCYWMMTLPSLWDVSLYRRKRFRIRFYVYWHLNLNSVDYGEIHDRPFASGLECLFSLKRENESLIDFNRSNATKRRICKSFLLEKLSERRRKKKFKFKRRIFGEKEFDWRG